MRALVLFVTLGTAGAAFAAVGEGPESEEIKLQKKRLQTVAVEEESSRERLESLETQLGGISDDHQKNVDLQKQLEGELVRLDVKLKESETSVTKLDEDLVKSTENFKAHYRDFASRALMLYETRSYPTLGFVLNATSFTEFTRRHEYHRILSQYDLQKIEELEIMRGEMQQRRDTLLRERVELEELRKLRQQKNEDLIQAIRQADGLKDSLSQELGGARGEHGRLRVKRTSVESRIQELENNRDQRITSRVEPGAPVEEKLERLVKPGSFGWPIDGDIEILRPFGSAGREQESDHDNPGIDIRVSGLTTVRSVESGKVIHRGELPSFGLVLMIDHGGSPDRVITVYGNLDSVLVTVGQWIDRGEPVALVGGRQGEQSLHLEIRKEAAPQDPMLWLER